MCKTVRSDWYIITIIGLVEIISIILLNSIVINKCNIIVFTGNRFVAKYKYIITNSSHYMFIIVIKYILLVGNLL